MESKQSNRISHQGFTASDVGTAVSNHERQSWMSVISRAEPADLGRNFSNVDDPPDFSWLRRPEIGLVMVRGRAGGTGEVFNLGEMTVTRCAVQLEDGTVGHGYIQGRDKRRAELAAILDALLQQVDRRETVVAKVIEPLLALEQARRIDKSRKAAATKVEFFTVVRREDPV